LYLSHFPWPSSGFFILLFDFFLFAFWRVLSSICGLRPGRQSKVMVAMKAWFIKPPSPLPAGGIESIIQIERRRGTDRDASSGLEIVGRSSYTYNRRRTLSLGSWSCGCSLIIAALYQKLSTADATQPHSRWQIPSSDQEEPSHNAPNSRILIQIYILGSGRRGVARIES